MPSEMEIIETVRQVRGVWEGYAYWKHKELKNGVRWACVKRDSHKCTGTVKTMNELGSGPCLTADHNHEPNVAEVEAMKALWKTKLNAIRSTNQPGRMYAELCQEVSNEAKSYLPTAERAKRTIRNYRLRGFPSNPGSLDELVIKAMGSPKIPYKVGFIGAGNMAKAIGNGILVSGTIPSENLIISAPSDRNLAFWKEKNVRTTHDNAAVIEFADIVFIAVKPQYFAGMVDGLKQSSLSVSKQICFVSIMVGKTVESVTDILKTVKGISGPFEVIKVMPNTPSMVGTGCSVMVSDKKSKFASVVRQIMELTGVCEEIPESLMNACGALSGSGPAYMYMVIEALADGGVKLGIPRELSYKLAAQTMAGAGKMVIDSGKHPGVLKDEVCSPGGSTITGVHELEKSGVRAAFMNAIAAAAGRSEQLGK